LVSDPLIAAGAFVIWIQAIHEVLLLAKQFQELNEFRGGLAQRATSRLHRRNAVRAITGPMLFRPRQFDLILPFLEVSGQIALVWTPLNWTKSFKAPPLTTARHPLSSVRRRAEGFAAYGQIWCPFFSPAVKFSVMENVASVWLLFGIGLIALNIVAQQFSFSGYRTLRRVLKILFDCYFSIFVLLDHLCHKSAVRTKLRVVKLSKNRGEYEADWSWSNIVDATGGR